MRRLKTTAQLICHKKLQPIARTRFARMLLTQRPLIHVFSSETSDGGHSRVSEPTAGVNSLESWTPTFDQRHPAMIYFRIFTILLATAFMLIVFYGDLVTVTSLLAGLCGGFVAVVAAQNNASLRLKAVEKRLEELEAKLIEGL